MKKNLLSVAGFDPSAGAGILLDIKVFEEMGFRGMGVLTAVTAQNTVSVKNVTPLPPSLIKEQYRTLHRDISFSGIKVGMVGTAENIRAIGRILAENTNIPRVIDPVFRSSSGTWLLEKGAIPAYLREIRGKASLITPNLEEASLITGKKVDRPENMKEAAERIFRFTHIPCLIKGGHLEKETLHILYDGKKTFLFGKKKIPKNVHGTGCFLASCLLCYLAGGYHLASATERAVERTYLAIKRAVRSGSSQSVFSFPLE
ncbi:MAG: hydroxymethylpyrimidine/phosphomethylpyrimidine kinase [Candidatus Aminicenantales bacterium]